ncbi:MAG: Ppx/GppA family phosphatase [Muribaculaceae bacterium]|nr:Ppx/GppA family phosphatase [Bacteroidales bacterium]MDY2734243.1 Ppx/GppA family phosphatase [Muribaculaceae bacterium]MDY4650616.1 Ppx/GppA family phosphatase [Muribaculaceae bacterium]
METNNYAAIDIGSNAARLLIKNVTEDSMGNAEFTKLLFLRIPLRLGKDVFTLGEISEERQRMMMCMIKSYKQLMKLYRVECFRACATSAMRDARNGEKLLKKIEKATGIKIEIVTGSEEARILYNNSIESAERVSGNYAYVDVGGGSTEISLLSNGQLVGSCSYNIGTLRKLSGMVPAEVEERLQLDLEEYAKQYPDIKIVGSGGNINRLSRIFHESNKKSKKNVLPVKNLREMYDDMKPLTVAEMMSRYGLKADRADVILPAAEIFLKVSEALNCEEIQVPNISLADCIIDGLYKSMRS